MKEVEVKAKVNDANLLKEKLKALGCELLAPINQTDEIFVPHGLTIPVPSGTNVLRIREQNGKYIFTLKQPQINELDCLEYETEIADPVPVREICRLLGFGQFSGVSKIRRKAKYQDYEICLDDVKDLGVFIEVEKMTDQADSAAVQNELTNFVLSLGVDKSDFVEHGYDILINLKYPGRFK